MKYRVIAPTVLVALFSAFPTLLEAGTNDTMRVGGRTSQPVGHYEYCEQNKSDCQISSFSKRPMHLSTARWNEMVEANTYANAAIKPVTDLQLYGKEEHWQMPVNYGDCEDYAILKRKWLMQQGWSASSLLVTVVRQKNGEGHAVLTVRTDRGDFILDNLKEEIKQWNQTDYTYLKRVSPFHSGWWEDILDTRNSIASVDSLK